MSRKMFKTMCFAQQNAIMHPHLTSVLVLIFCQNFVQTHDAHTPYRKRYKIYDFIIVGGGTAGTVLATRLSEITSWEILLLEAGGRDNVFDMYPAITAKYQHTNLDWHYATEPQRESCAGLKDRKLYWPAGKVLGGTSEINYMVYTRGNQEDYDRWAREGNPGWSYAEVLPYFLKSENYKFQKYNVKYHNKSGPMSIQHPYTTNITDVFLKSATEIGYDVGDYNGKSQLRFSKIKAHMANGERHSVFRAFLEPVYCRRPNLTVTDRAQVTKILINARNNKAIGVAYVKNNRAHVAFAKKRVILSAGVVGSSKLLMLSGIGPKVDLEQLHIPLIQDLPVGQGICDHITYFGLNYLTNLQDNFNNFGSYQMQMSRCNGTIASSPAGFEAIGFVKLDETKHTNSTVPDVQILLANHVFNRYFKLLTNIEDTLYDRYFKMAENFVGANIFPILLHPKSRGYIKLRSADPFDPPIIEPRYLSVEEDEKTLVKGIKFVVERIIQTKSFKNADAALYPIPVCEQFQINSDRYWECAVKTLTMSFNDFMGGCKMGPKGRKEAVVDHKLQVHGVDHLMVVDASVIPVTISGQVGAATIMIAEKAADIIKEEYHQGNV